MTRFLIIESILVIGIIGTQYAEGYWVVVGWCLGWLLAAAHDKNLF